jgi:MFS superfamily sulfate permease-like transporter
VLSVIIISALVGLFDFKAAWLIWKTDKLDFVCLLGAFFGVVFKSVEIGILIAVAISVAKLIFQVTRPHTGQPVDHRIPSGGAVADSHNATSRRSDLAFATRKICCTKQHRHVLFAGCMAR